MAKSPDNRFRNAQQMLGVLNQVSAKERSVAPEAEAPASVDKPSRSWLKPVGVSVVAAALLIAAALWLRPGAEKAPSTDFYTGNEPAPAPAPVASPAPLPPAIDVASAGSIAAATPPSSLAPPPEAAPVAVAPALPAAVGAADFAGVVASVTVDPLGFDPTQPGARELRAADRQLKQNRLSTPPGDNAADSLLAAAKAGAPPEALEGPSDKLIAAFGTGLAGNLRSGDLKSAEATYKRAASFADKAGRTHAPAWKKFRDALPALLVARLNKAAEVGDAAGLALAKALARTMELDPKLLEPAWSREVVAPKPGRPAAGPGPAVVLVIPAAPGKPGVAFMRQEVSRGDYAAFASSTGRGSAKCKNRLAPISLKKRSWSAPGFEQAGSHPAVCVSYEDARAYAAWLSERTGETFRLPTAAEWRRISSYSGSGNACADGRVSCGQEGTVPAGQGPASPLGLMGAKGNVREWLLDCAGSCKDHLVGGLGWRDSASKPQGNRTDGLNADSGFDDVGFRLVREVSAR
jgi:hypothetical protein